MLYNIVYQIKFNNPARRGKGAKMKEIILTDAIAKACEESNRGFAEYLKENVKVYYTPDHKYAIQAEFKRTGAEMWGTSLGGIIESLEEKYNEFHNPYSEKNWVATYPRLEDYNADKLQDVLNWVLPLAEDNGKKFSFDGVSILYSDEGWTDEAVSLETLFVMFSEILIIELETYTGDLMNLNNNSFFEYSHIVESLDFITSVLFDIRGC